MKRLLRFGIFAAIAAAVFKMVASKKAEWDDLTEDQVRDKLQSKLSGRVPPEKLDDIQDKVVGKMKSRGKLRDNVNGPVSSVEGDL